MFSIDFQSKFCPVTDKHLYRSFKNHQKELVGF